MERQNGIPPTPRAICGASDRLPISTVLGVHVDTESLGERRLNDEVERRTTRRTLDRDRHAAVLVELARRLNLPLDLGERLAAPRARYVPRLVHRHDGWNTPRSGKNLGALSGRFRNRLSVSGVLARIVAVEWAPHPIFGV